jgi:hypothetical protein
MIQDSIGRNKFYCEGMKIQFALFKLQLTINFEEKIIRRRETEKREKIDLFVVSRNQLSSPYCNNLV